MIALNATRMRDSRLLAAACLAVLLFTRPAIAAETGLHLAMQMAGYGLLVAGVGLRIWCTAYIGGWKNERMVAEGPYSVVRNPLYVGTLLAAAGIGLMTGYLVVAAAAIVVLPLIYAPLIRREEDFLAARFGEDYASYARRVPRWIPDLRLHRPAETVELKPRFLLFALRDSFAFLAAYPMIELIEYLRRVEVLPSFFTLP